MTARLERVIRAVAARATSPAALRLRVRLRRHQNAVLAALLGLGILLMILHWSGRSAGRGAFPPRAGHELLEPPGARSPPADGGWPEERPRLLGPEDATHR